AAGQLRKVALTLTVIGLYRPQPQRRRQQHDQPGSAGHSAGRDPGIEQTSTYVSAGGDGQHREAKVGRKDAAPKTVISMKLQQRRREDPDRRSSCVREHGAGTRHPDRAAEAEGAVSDRDDEITEKDAELQPPVAASRPARRDQRTNERSQ